MPTRRRFSFVSWVAWNEVALAASFLFPSLLLVNAVISGWDPPLQFLSVVAGGAIQGFVMGLTQWGLLTRGGITPPLLPWLGFTISGVAVAWIIGQLPGFLPSATSPNVRLPLVAGVSLLAVTVPMVAQWVVLRHVARSAWAFVGLSWLGWVVGLTAFGAVLVVLARITDLKITIALLVATAFFGVLAVSVMSWFGVRRLATR